MFGDKVKPNRRLTPAELEQEIITAKAFCRPVRSFINDMPTYPFFPPAPVANFDLRFKNK